MTVKFSIARGALLPALAAVNRAVEKRNTIPILGNVLLKPEDGALTITGTNLDIEVKSVTKQESIPDFAPFTVPSGLLHDAVHKLPDGSTVEFEGDGAHVNVKAGRSRFRLQVLPASDFPEMSADGFTHEFKLPGKTLAHVVATVGFAISTEETRYYLNGIHLHHDGTNLAAVATDGHRLALVKLDAPEGSKDMPGIIVPRRTVGLLQHFAKGDDDIKIQMSTGKIRLSLAEGTTITSRLIDGTFPDYQRVIPSGGDKSFVLDRTAVSNAIDRVATISTERGRAVKCTFTASELTLEVTNPDSGQSEDSVVVDEGSGEDISIGFNHRYCLDVLAATASKQIRFELSDPGAPAKVFPTDTVDGGEPPLFVIMPMRV